MIEDCDSNDLDGYVFLSDMRYEYGRMGFNPYAHMPISPYAHMLISPYAHIICPYAHMPICPYP